MVLLAEVAGAAAELSVLAVAGVADVAGAGVCDAELVLWSGVAAEEASEVAAGIAAAAEAALVSEDDVAEALEEFWQVSATDFTLLTLYMELSVESTAPCSSTWCPTFLERSSCAPASLNVLPD